MSLINQMLRDLDARESERPNLVAVDSPKPVATRVAKQSSRKWGLLVALIFILAATGWFGSPQIQQRVLQIIGGGTAVVADDAATDPAADSLKASSPTDGQAAMATSTPSLESKSGIQLDTSDLLLSGKQTLPTSTQMSLSPQIKDEPAVVSAPRKEAMLQPELLKMEVISTEVPAAPIETLNDVEYSVTKPQSESTKLESAEPRVVPTSKAVVISQAAIKPVKLEKSDQQLLSTNAKVKPKSVKPVSQIAPTSVTTGEAETTIKVKTVINPIDLAGQHYAAAISAQAAGRYEESMRRLKLTLGANPNHGEARKLLVKLHMNSGSIIQGLAVINQGLKLNPGEASLVALKARIAIQQGNLKSAQKLLTDGLSHHSDNPELLTMLGVVLQQNDRFEEALSVYRKLVFITPNSGRNWAGLAMSYDANNRSKKALDAYRKAINFGGLPSNVNRYAQRRITALEMKR